MIKKIFLLIVILFSSYSFGQKIKNGTSSNEAKVLLKKAVCTDSRGITTTFYNYIGNKIVSITNDRKDKNMFFTYTGDLITKIETKFPDSEKTNFNTILEYDNKNRLKSAKRLFLHRNEGELSEYTYKLDGSIIETEYTGDLKIQKIKSEDTNIYYLKNKEIVKNEVGQFRSNVNSYSFDDKNSPHKNILGFDKIKIILPTFEGVEHNCLNYESSYGGEIITLKSKITYNSDNYPSIREITKKVSYRGASDSKIPEKFFNSIEFFY
ncbi:hypothetical protein [Flavobacterium limi]|uniref:YD repeat-containing protein n=1 Tax=Flavobacterium limi TaxID=2045105 RepID=A0ABQ1TKI4_9FLAO|nr:hypothetical protein [Flavobacterium limi]GGE95691.1 hypothetical protein GCM10011518_01250 [Flavobacterium limi]